MSKFNPRYVKNLPDYYAKSTQSNNYKLLEIGRLAVSDLKNDISAIFDTLDLNKCSSRVLDMYGEMLGQPRGKATDLQYAYLLRAKIARNLVQGDNESIVHAMAMTFECDHDEFAIVEAEEPCTIELIKLPFRVIVYAGFTSRQAVAIIQTVLPIAISFESVAFEGTFEFSDMEMEYNARAGFCDVEDGDIGGFFGILLGQDDEAILPI